MVTRHSKFRLEFYHCELFSFKNTLVIHTMQSKCNFKLLYLTFGLTYKDFNVFGMLFFFIFMFSSKVVVSRLYGHDKSQ